MGLGIFEEWGETYLGWLTSDFAFARRLLPEPPFIKGKYLVYECSYTKITLYNETLQILTYLSDSKDNNRGYELGCVVSFIERKYRAGLFSGLPEEQMEKISRMLRPHAQLLSSSEFLGARKTQLDDFRIKWLKSGPNDTDLF